MEENMCWSEIRQTYPSRWLVIEALEAHTTPGSLCELDRVAVVELCTDSSDAYACYRRIHQQFPSREFVFVHTSREELRFRERFWVGIRPRSDTSSTNIGAQ